MLGPKTDNQVSDSNGVQQAGRDIHGISPEQHERMLQKALDALRADLESKFQQANRADVAERRLLQGEIGELQRRLVDPENALKAKQERKTDVNALLGEFAVGIGENRLKDAESAMAMDDYSKADAIFAEVQEHDARAVKRSAKAAYGQGLIAEEQVRWADAAEHYSCAARLNPGYETLIKAGKFLSLAGRHADAIQHKEQLVVIAKTEFGAEHEKTVAALNNLATSYLDTGRYEEAEPLFRKVLMIDCKTHVEARPVYAIHLNNFASLLEVTGRFDEAEPLFREALEIDRKGLGRSHSRYAADLSNLAALLKTTGRYDEAEPLFREALAIDCRELGEAHPDYAIDLNNLAVLLEATGRFGEAETLYREALEITLKTLGEAHPDYAGRLNNLANLLITTGCIDEGEPLLREALAVFEVALGAEHPTTTTGS